MPIFSQPITSANYQFTQWNGWTRQQQYPRYLADVNGDGNADIVGFASDGVYVALGHPDGIFSSPLFASDRSPGDLGPLGVGDVNGDGRADLIEPALGFYLSAHPSYPPGVFQPQYIDIMALLGKTDGTFAVSTFAARNWFINDRPIPANAFGDVNGDGRADLVIFSDSDYYALSVALGQSDGTFSGLPTQSDGPLGPSAGWTSQDLYPRELGDVNGDGRADLVGFGASGYMSRWPTPTGRSPSRRWHLRASRQMSAVGPVKTDTRVSSAT